MLLGDGLGALTYCMNIHPAESWQECRAALTGPVRAVKQQLAPEAPFAVGLRFSARAVEALAVPDARRELKDILEANDFLPVTVNGFPYGPFHGTRVKEDVYLPDWRSQERLDYTNRLADVMADIAAGDGMVSLSTVPGAFKPLGRSNEDAIAENLIRAAAHCVTLERDTGRTVAIAIEPEPYCFLETVAESIAFFESYLFSGPAVRRLGELAGLDNGAAEAALRRHLGLCYDVCHAAVEYEDAGTSLAALQKAGIAVNKLQLSAALRVPSVDEAARRALAAFAEPTYLHQVVARRGEELAWYRDLPEALARGAGADGEEWRVHFHVPVFVEALEAFGTTQGFLAEILARHKAAPIAPHLEVETYTWTVLPAALREEPMETAIGRELQWVLERLGREAA